MLKSLFSVAHRVLVKRFEASVLVLSIHIILLFRDPFLISGAVSPTHFRSKRPETAAKDFLQRWQFSVTATVLDYTLLICTLLPHRFRAMIERSKVDVMMHIPFLHSNACLTKQYISVTKKTTTYFSVNIESKELFRRNLL